MGLFNYLKEKKLKAMRDARALIAAEESAKTRAMLSQIRTMEEVIDWQGQHISDLQKQLRSSKSSTTEERVLDMLSNLFMKGQSPQSPSSPVPVLESGVSLTDDQIRRYLMSIPTKHLTKALTENPDTIKRQLASTGMNLNDDTIARAYQIAKEIVEV